MGLAADLGYERSAQNVVQRWVVTLVSTRPVSALSRRLLPSVDRFLLRVTAGRSTMTSLASGLPVLWLTTVGARSGEKRTVPLLGFPVGDDLAVLGTHFGSRSTPGWVHNLEADPTATVGYRGKLAPVQARPADPHQTDVVWDLAADAYPGYAQYAERATHRMIRVFVLGRADPIDESAPGVGS
jgi:deazaflavin-dependent oxidoreductase (nitroreductase family)